MSLSRLALTYSRDRASDPPAVRPKAESRRADTKGSTTNGLPLRVRQDVQRILDGAARRLLSEQVDSHTLGPSARADSDALDDRADKRASLDERQAVPV
ncbi:MAG: hypothetical protein QOE25_1577 [Actinomycetota bacterium]|nr:hypothetical protein [Actinomycetota bacterium]